MSPEFKTGYHFGIFADLPVKNNIYVKAELIYSDKGSSSPATTLAESYTLYLDYLNMPVILGYNPVKGLNIEIGLQPGYLVFARSVSKGQSSSFIDFFYNKFSLDYVTGIEYFIDKLGLGVRYEHSLNSLSDIETRNEEGIGKRINEFNKNFQAYIAYKF